jgi:signal transduction histidine kinase
MRSRLVLSTAAIALAAVIILGVPLGAVEAARLRQEGTSRLEREADAVASAIDDRIERHRPISPALLGRFVPARHRITVTTHDGRRVTTGPRIDGQVLAAHSGSALEATVLAQAPIEELNHRVYREWLLIAALGIAGVLAAVGLALLQARRLARPLEAIARRSAELGDGDFSVRAGSFEIPEIDAIAHGLDSSAERIAELVAREREFSANVSHQLRTPLTALRLRIEAAEATDDGADRGEQLAAAASEVDRLEATIADLLDHARHASADQVETVNLGVVVHEHAARWRPVFARARRAFEVTGDKNALVRASRGTVGQILDVLLENALRHGAGAVAVIVRVDGRAATVTVTDAGPGITPDAQERIFERGASQAGGTGIGLHLARALAEADHGSLRALPGPGARFELRMPQVAS